MKILYIIHQFYPMHHTGTEKFLLNLSSSIQRWGHNVKVITYSFYKDSFYSQSKGNILLHEFLYKGIPVIAYKYKQMPRDMDYALDSIELSHVADEIIQREKPDLLHVAHPIRTAEFINAAIRYGIPYLVTLTDFWLLCPKSILYTSQGTLCAGPAKGESCRTFCPEYQYDSIVHRLEQSDKLLSNARSVIAPSRFLGGIFQNEFTNLKLKHIPYGIDYKWIRRNSKYYCEDDELKLTYAGQLAYHKGIHILIEAFKRLLAKKIKLNIYGSGLSDQEASFKEMSANDPRIEFCGVYNETQVGEILKNSDVIVIPSTWHENNTIVMREALACNVPVVVSDAGGMTEIVKDGVNGFVFSMGDPDHLYEILKNIIKTPQILNPLKKKISSSMMMMAVEQEAFAYLREYRTCLSNNSCLRYTPPVKFVQTSLAGLFTSIVQKSSLGLDKAFGGKLFPDGSKRKIVLNAFINMNLTVAILKYQLCHRGLKGVFNAIRIAWKGGSVSATHEIPFVKTQSLAILPLLEDETPKDVNPGISVLIPTFNEAENLLNLLRAIKSQKGFKNIEIVIVDSGSTDDTIKIAQEFDTKIALIKPEEFTYSFSRNLCAENASEDYVLFTSADALPSSDLWLYKMFVAMEKNGVTAVTCTELPRSDADLYIRVVLWDHVRHILQISGEDKILSMPTGRDSTALRKHAQLTSVALLIRKDMFLQYRFRKEYAEDLDLGIRLLADSGKIALLASNPIVHSHNRPPYFHLKRAYVDKLVVADILNERLDEPKIRYDELIGDIVKIYRILTSIRIEDVLSNRNQLPAGELANIIHRISAMSKDIPSSDITVENNDYLDSQFKFFLERIVVQYRKNPSNYSSCGLVLNELIRFLWISVEYMKDAHEQLDEFLLKDYFSLMYKCFANSIGAYAALCYANADPSKDSRLQILHSELMDKRILWEKKVNHSER